MNPTQKITEKLMSLANPAEREHMDNYFCGAVRHIGVRQPRIKAFFSEFYSQNISGLPVPEQFDLGIELLKSEYAEEKSLGIMVFNRCRKHLQPEFLRRLAPLVDLHVYDWGTADTLASSVLGEAVRDNDEWAELLFDWRKAGLWRQRIVCVAFLRSAKAGVHAEHIFAIASEVIRNQERFAQLGVGWLLREAFLSWPDVAARFVRENYELFSREGLRYAIRKLPECQRQNWLHYR